MARTPQIIDDALGAVGNTPLVRLDRIAKEEGLQCNLREYMRLILFPAISLNSVYVFVSRKS